MKRDNETERDGPEAPAIALSIFMVCAALLLPGPAHAAFIMDASAGARNTDNVNNAATTKKGDTLSTLHLSFGGYTQLADYTGASLTVDLHKETSGYSGLNLVSSGLSLALTHKVGLGPAAPRLNLYGSASNENYSDDYRDSTSYKIGIFASEWVHERVKVGLGYEFDKRITASSYGITFGSGGSGGSGDSGNGYAPKHASSYGTDYANIYDLQGNSGILDVELIITEKDLLFLSYRYRSGDVVSVDSRSLKALNVSSAWSADNTFTGLVAYRLKAVSHIATVEVSHELARKWSLNLGYAFNMTAGDGGNDYQTNRYNLAIAYSY